MEPSAAGVGRVSGVLDDMIEKATVVAVMPLWITATAGAVSWWAVHWMTGGMKNGTSVPDYPVGVEVAPRAS